MPSDDFDKLIERCLDGVAEQAEYAELEAAIREDSSRRRHYVAVCHLRQALSEELSRAKNDAPSTATPAARRAWYAIAGCLALAASLLFALAFFPSDPKVAIAPDEPSMESSPSNADPPASDVIAEVVEKINCVWRDESWSLDPSSEIHAGQTIMLERGFMQLALRNGVTIVMEGPAEFTLVDELRGALEFGGLGVRVPEGFSGYIVDTPSAKVTDLGTEFSLRVASDGATDLCVIDGEVEVSGKGGTATEEPRRLTKDAAWSSVTGLRRPQGPPIPGDFPTAGLLVDPAFDTPPEMPVTDKLLLWLSADVAVKADSHGGVVAWGDISSRVASDRHSAWQVETLRRPQLVRDESGASVVRFDGEDDCLITEPFATGNAQTIAVVARFKRLKPTSSVIPTQQIINYNGPPHLVIERRRWGKLRGTAFAGPGKEPEYSGRIKATTISKGQLFALIYTYNHSNDQAVLYLDGKPCGEAQAAFPIASARPKVIGHHRRLSDGAFNGDLLELAIYDRALNGEEIEALSTCLSERHGIGAAALEAP